MSKLETYISENESRFLTELQEWLRIPSISTAPEHVNDVHNAANFAALQLQKAGLENTEVLSTARHPLVYGDWLKAEGKPTILIYGHYDVQPVDPIELWDSPPFEPTIRNGNLYARGAADDKGQVMLVIKALESLMQAEGTLPVNVKVLLEGEEEDGGVSVEHYVQTHAEHLRCDAALICDTHMPAEDIPSLIYGLRGIVYTEVEVQGARRDLHSGTYGGIAPNPLHALAIIISRLKDAEGHIQIPGLYERLRQPTQQEIDFWNEDPLNLTRDYLEEMGVQQLSGEQEYPPMQRIWALPTLEVHGISGGFVGEGAKTVIPAVAKAKISLRIPPDLKTKEVFALFEQAVKAVTPADVQVKVIDLHSGEGALVSPDSAPMRAAARALTEIYGKPPIYVREGGSIPIAALFDQVLQAPVVLMGFGLPDDNLHAPNEKISIKQFYRGIRTVTRFLQHMA